MQHSLFQKLTVSQLVDKPPTIYAATIPITMHGPNSKSQRTVRISLLAVCDWYTNWWPSVKCVTVRTESPFGICKHHCKDPRTVGQICLQHRNLLLLRKECFYSFYNVCSIYSFYNVYSTYSFSSLGNTKKVKKLRMRWSCSMMGEVKNANRILAYTAQMT